jgi:hypothetical protein
MNIVLDLIAIHRHWIVRRLLQFIDFTRNVNHPRNENHLRNSQEM